MIKKAYFRGLMKVAAEPKKQMSQEEKDRMLVGGGAITDGSIYGGYLKYHGFYKDTPSAARNLPGEVKFYPPFLRNLQADLSAVKFAPRDIDPVYKKLENYYQNIGRQNRDFYLKQGFRPPADHKYKTPFPFPNHPKKKQMMLQNQHQVNNNRGQQYNGHA